MYPITNTVKALFEAENAQVLRITGTDKNGTSISITDANIEESSFSIDRYSCNSEKLEIGTAIAAQVELKLDNYSGTYDSVVFEGTELFVEIGTADWSATNTTVYYVPIGYFTPDEQPRKKNSISLKALDRMTRFDAVQPTLMKWTDNNGNVMTDGNGNELYFNSYIAFPCTISQLIGQCCMFCNVPFDQDISSLPNASYTVTALPSLQQDITYRTIIQWCAGIMGTCAYIDWNGKLRFAWYDNDTSYSLTEANRFSSDLYENDVTITGVMYTNTQGATLVAGSTNYMIDLTGNYLA